MEAFESFFIMNDELNAFDNIMKQVNKEQAK